MVTPPNAEQITFSPTDRPVTDILSVLVVRNNAVKVGLYVYNSAGQSVYTYSYQQSAGGQTYSIPMKRLAKGVYYVTVLINDKKAVTKKLFHE